MAWDQSRRVPWKRLLTFEGIYVGLFAVFVLVVQRDHVASAVTSILVAVAITTLFLFALVKFGYQPNWLRSREEMAEIRRQRIEARQAIRAAKSGKPVAKVDDTRYRPAPTRRTSSGPTNRPRNIRANRKR